MAGMPFSSELFRAGIAAASLRSSFAMDVMSSSSASISVPGLEPSHCMKLKPLGHSAFRVEDAARRPKLPPTAAAAAAAASPPPPSGGAAAPFGVQALYAVCETETVGVLYHPFVRAKLTGDLPQSSFASFLQDERHLLAAAASISRLRQLKALVRDVSLSPSDAAKEMMSFMLEMAEESDCAASVCLAAFLRMRIVLERHLKACLSDYEDWMAAYGTAEFQACAYILEDDAEKEIKRSRGVVSKEKLLKVFKQTVMHQTRVLSAAYSGQDWQLEQRALNPWHPSNLLFTTDYDVTCTVRDTSDVIVSLAQRNRGVPDLEGRYWSLMQLHDARIKSCLALWSYEAVTPALTAAAAGEQEKAGDDRLAGMDAQLQHLLAELRKQEQAAGAAHHRKFHNPSLRAVLRQLGDLELRINEEVMEAGVLKGARREQIREEVRKIPLHARCAEVLSQLAAMKVGVHFISATWSRDLVLGGVPLPRSTLFVHSNDLEYDDEGVSNGRFKGVVQDAFDKEAVLQALEAAYEQQQQQQQQQRKMTVFLGDSTNDLLALLNADIGIVIGRNLALAEMIQRAGLQRRPLVLAAARISASLRHENQHQPLTFRNTGILFEASSWAEVEACLLNNNTLA